MKSYLSDRKQQIRISSVLSSWAKINKAVPQGSILGPLLLNVFINDIFYFIKKCTLYNNADDNTLSFHSPDFNELIMFLQQDWFSFKCMQANPESYKPLLWARNDTITCNITCEEVVKLLGVDIDFNLSSTLISVTFAKKPHNN